MEILDKAYYRGGVLYDILCLAIIYSLVNQSAIRLLMKK